MSADNFWSKKYFIIAGCLIILFFIVVAVFVLLCFRASNVGPVAPPASVITFSDISPEEVWWLDPVKPLQSFPMEKKDIPADAVRITINEGVIAPETFDVIPGQQVVLAFINNDPKWSHIIRFEEESLIDVSVGLRSGEIKIITFFAPAQKGEYGFKCILPLHNEKGIMIVK